jgi:uncharacterized protein
MTDPNTLGGLIGGALIGLAAVLLLALNGRIAGISGILGGLITSTGRGDRFWRCAFIFGLLAGAGLYALICGGLPTGTSSTRPDAVGCRFARRRGNTTGLRLHFGPRRLRSSAPFAALAAGNYDFYGRRRAHRLFDASHILMAQIAVAFAVGIIFALGLAVSEMINPARVIGFLDVAGRWDPTLLLVMAGALAVTVPLFPLILRRSKPIFAAQFSLPTKTRLDPPLVIGAAIFGAGWGLAGFCPGPALAALASGSPNVILFVAAMLVGQWSASRFEER